MEKKKIQEKDKDKDINIKFKKLNNFWKIRRGSNYNAFHRKNLGSIPSKIDNFIFKLPDELKERLLSTLEERKQMHRVNKLNISISNDEIDKFLRAKGIDPSTF